MNNTLKIAVTLLLFLFAGRTHAALGDESVVVFVPTSDALAIVENKAAASLVVDPADWPGVRRTVGDLQADIERVSSIRPAIEDLSALNGELKVSKTPILIGTLGRSSLIDELVNKGKIDVAPIAGHWEAFLLQVVENPLPGLERALVIVGSDKRGTIYGVYEISEQIGVSPWYWWADVPTTHRDSLFVRSGRVMVAEPKVKYRGIFLNDEAPDLSNWVTAKFGAAPVRANPPVPEGVANYGHEFYSRIFEVLLRLRANYLWPAMWNNAFNEDDPANALLADGYGIVMGTSHQEPMLRAQKEWDRRYKPTLGSWNYAKHPEVLESFWREGIRRNKAFESLITIGLRGANDTEMAPGGPRANRVLLEKIIDVQRRILREEMNTDLKKIPQLWCLYKEVQEFYEDGMRAPDDVTLLWAEDNWGNVRRLPTTDERKRSGGAGIYYHLDYHGGPRNYQWVNTSPIPKIWEQMSLATQYGADRIWIVNVGHFKGCELSMEFFLNLAWNPARWTNETLGDFTRLWAAREFGPEQSAEIADIVAKYTKYNGRRKPELLAPDTYSLTDYQEAEAVTADFKAIAGRSEKIFQSLRPDQRDAFYQLVLFPTKASALVNTLYLAAGKNALYARQGRASANDQAARTQKLFQADLDLMKFYNTSFAGGRWEHFMDQIHLGYTSWNEPPANSLNHIKLVELTVPEAAALGVAIEGSGEAWPDTHSKAKLPRFDALNQQSYFIEVFNRGKTPFDFTATADGSWIKLSETAGSVGLDRRLWVEVNWERAPAGVTRGTVKIVGAGREVAVQVEALKPEGVTRETLEGFAEGAGYVSIEPEHFSRNISAGENHWNRIDDYGRTLSGMRAEGLVDAPAAKPGKDSPCLEYRMYLHSSGKAEVVAITAPTLNFIPDRPVRYAVSFDDEKPQVVTLVPKDFRVQSRAWEKSVADNAHMARSTHNLDKPGYHTLKIWMIDPAVVMQKLIVNLGGLHPSYLGPPESTRVGR